MRRAFLRPWILLLAACTPANSQQAQNTPPQPTGYPPQQYPQQYPPQYPPQQYPQQQPQPYPQPTPYPTPPQPQPQPTYPVPPQPTVAPTMAPTTAPTTAPTPAPTPTTGPFPFPFPMPFPTTAPTGSTPPAAGGAATPIDPNLASAATVPLMALAATDAQGMQREGNIAAGQFREGDSLEVPMQLNPGKCYTVLAVGAGIQEMHIILMAATPIPGQFQEVARDSGGGAQASLGGKGNCYKWPWPVGAQGKWVMKATRGSGVAAGALYVK